MMYMNSVLLRKQCAQIETVMTVCLDDVNNAAHCAGEDAVVDGDVAIRVRCQPTTKEVFAAKRLETSFLHDLADIVLGRKVLDLSGPQLRCYNPKSDEDIFDHLLARFAVNQVLLALP